LNVTFERLVIVSPSATVDFEAVSRTMPLRIAKSAELMKSAKFIFTLLSLVAVGLFAVSLTHRMIGAELLVCFQVVLLSNCPYQKWDMFTYATQGTGAVSGGWPLFGTALSPSVPTLTNRILMSLAFLNNSFVVVSLLLLFSLILAALALALNAKTPSEKASSKSLECLRGGSRILYGHLLFPLSVGFCVPLALGVFVSCLRLSAKETFLGSPTVNSLGIWAALALTACLAGLETLGRNSRDPLLR
jgi:hypothetical protein